MQATVERCGITAAGNWIVDCVKTVDRLPGRGMLANVLSQSRSTGGAAANVLLDLARLGCNFPLSGLGVVGRDADGDLIIATARNAGIDVSRVVRTTEAPTSYTDVMAEATTGDRSFFHCRGANALFGPEHVDIAALRCRIFHLGYLLLLDRFDQPHPETGTVAAALLRDLQAVGIKTSVDVVSEESDRFRALVPPALRYVNYLLLNEIEASRVTGLPVRDTSGRLLAEGVVAAAEALCRLGETELVAVHMPEGVYLRTRSGEKLSLGACALPPGFVRGTVGAGDAFCAGMLYGLHEGWDLARAADLGICSATACLAHPTASDGLAPVAEVVSLAARFPRRTPPVRV